MELYTGVCQSEPVSVLVGCITRLEKWPRAKNDDAPFFTPQVCAERALAADPHHLPAVYVLASVLEADNRIDAAIELLRSHLNHQSTSQLHLMLADLLGKDKLKWIR